MEFISVTSIGGSIWSFRKDRIELVTKRFSFSQKELDMVQELHNLDSCTVIKLIGDDNRYFCRDSYESIMEQLNQ